jgi:hypothetical protein
MATVIVGDDIQRYRLLAIKACLRLESTGMRGKIKASVIARQILNKAGLKAAVDKRRLFIQFSDYINSLEN